jgi:hypothetical protein
MGVDFRGYYASGQIARAHGFAAVYNQALQREFQASLLYRCPIPAEEEPLYVAMPYLPLFVILFLPFTYLEFTASYLLWTGLQFGLFAFTLHRLSHWSLGARSRIFPILLWGIGLPLIANLYLGQINALLVFLFSQFALTFYQARHFGSGIWLSTMLIKPHTLILLLPGLFLGRKWGILLGFCLGAATILFSSLLLAGFSGLAAMGHLTFQFAGTLILNPAGMMNWRALGLSLGVLLPSWVGWSLAGILALGVAYLVLRQWQNRPLQKGGVIGILAVTLLGTFIVSWHSHFYMHILLPPLLLVMDNKGLLPSDLRHSWLLGPPIFYLVVHLVAPALEGSLFGFSMLALSVFMLLRLLPLKGKPVGLLDKL